MVPTSQSKAGKNPHLDPAIIQAKLKYVDDLWPNYSAESTITFEQLQTVVSSPLVARIFRDALGLDEEEALRRTASGLMLITPILDSEHVRVLAERSIELFLYGCGRFSLMLESRLRARPDYLEVTDLEATILSTLVTVYCHELPTAVSTAEALLDEMVVCDTVRRAILTQLVTSPIPAAVRATRH